MRVAVVIPARKNSSRVAGKNMMEVGGKPCLQYGIERAKASKYHPTIAVVSDDPKALDLAESLDVIALEEPKHLANDDNLYHVFRWTLRLLEKHIDRFEYMVKGVASVPIAPPDIIDRLIKRVVSASCQSVIPVMELSCRWHPYGCLRQVYDGRMIPYLIGDVWINSQKFPPLYIAAGGETIFRRDAIDLVAEDRFKSLQLENRAIFVAENDIVEVDTPEDVLWAEYLLGRTEPVSS